MWLIRGGAFRYFLNSDATHLYGKLGRGRQRPSRSRHRPRRWRQLLRGPPSSSAPRIHPSLLLKDPQELCDRDPCIQYRFPAVAPCATVCWAAQAYCASALLMVSTCWEIAHCMLISKSMGASSRSRATYAGHGGRSVYADFVVETPI